MAEADDYYHAYKPAYTSKEHAAKLEAEIERLRGLLAKHGGHTAECPRSGPVVLLEDECINDCNWQTNAKTLEVK